ncbi:hypothetical protein [Halomarina oriensis]|uniref:Uncharacterized protein n=1 Tax=Halomarina oriensis TaxID=671145 RepID=A0A6B0GF52_9EURY|nr:hypothetical protein [Halomarina oriensis]MWG33130.1 hypothetical protein [Halomarina oriensis]
MSSALNPCHPKAIGETVEAVAVQEVENLTFVPDREAQWHDAVVEGVLCPRVADIGFVGIPLLESGTAVEIKGAQLTSGAARGRWFIRQRQHERLVEERGAYLLCVHDRRGEELLAMAVILASTLEGLLPDGWTSVDGDRSEQGYRQLAWSRVFDPEDVEGRR